MEIQNQPATKLHQIKPVFSTPLVTPIADTEKIMHAWKNFQNLKLELLDDSDYVTINGEKYGRKSAFRKLALAFGISTEIMREERVELKNGFCYEITMKATAPSGRFMTAVASCHSNERQFNKDSDVRAISQTRATTRCIGDLISWSTPSAEEMMTDMPGQDNVDAKSILKKNWFQEIVSNPENRPVRTEEQIASRLLSDKQRSLLVSLIGERIHEPNEREQELEKIQSLTKSEASELISKMLDNKFN